MTGVWCDDPDWVPTGPLFPKGIGEVVHAILHPQQVPGSPYTHTFSYPPTEYDEDGNPLPSRIRYSVLVYPRGAGKGAHVRARAVENAESAVLRIVRAEVRDAVARDVRCALLKTPPHRLTNSPNIDRLLT